MNRRIAAYHLARRYPDWDCLAALMGKRPDTLRKELTGCDGYKWGVDDEEMLIAICIAAKVADPLAPLTAAAVNAGAILIPLPPADETPSATFKCLADTAHEFGAFMSTVGESVADNDVTANEVREAERHFGLLVSKGQACVSSMISLQAARKPADIRRAA